MMRVMAILFVIVAAAVLLVAAPVFGHSSSAGILRPDVSGLFASVSNSTNISINSTGKINENSSASQQNVGSASKGSFEGYYGMTASLHEMGKNSIESRMFLNGTFEINNTVKFQDRGV